MNDEKRALMVLDMMNEIVRADGAWAKMGYGYGPQAEERQVVEKTARAIQKARGAGIPVIYVTVGFSKSYAEWPSDSPVFTEEGKKAELLQLGTWGQDIHEALAPGKESLRLGDACRLEIARSGYRGSRSIETRVI
jgi:nicotinamidase-related amidase